MTVAHPFEPSQLDVPLHSRLSDEAKDNLLKQLCGRNILSPSAQGLDLSTQCYHQYLEEQCMLATADNGPGFRTQATYSDIVRIVDALQSGLDRQHIRERLQKQYLLLDSNSASSKYGCGSGNGDVSDDTIDLAVRLWLMILSGRFRQISIPGTSLEWTEGSLQETLRQRFQKDASMKDSIKLEKFFNARNLQRIAGMKIIWTNNLLDHLRVQDDDTRVSLFSHATFLHHHMETRIFPPGLIEETLRTLALLLPRHDLSVKKWYACQSRQFNLDPNTAKGRNLNTHDRRIENFEYWHDRLVILKEVFDDAEPSTIWQWWEDRRRRVQWYTFWIAALVLGLTIFFGTLQTVEGGLQVWKAYHPS